MYLCPTCKERKPSVTTLSCVIVAKLEAEKNPVTKASFRQILENRMAYSITKYAIIECAHPHLKQILLTNYPTYPLHEAVERWLIPPMDSPIIS